jgi:hypothetical protein
LTARYNTEPVGSSNGSCQEMWTLNDFGLGCSYT